MTRAGHGVPAGVQRRQPDGAGQHAAGHVARQVRRDRPRVEQILLAQPEVVATARRTGRAEYDEHVQGVEAAEIDVGLRETGRGPRRAARRAAPQLLDAAGTNVTIGQPISHRIDHMLSGTRANIAVKIVRRRPAPRCAGSASSVRDAMAGVAGRRRPLARAADGHAVRPLRPQPRGDRALRACAPRTSRRPSRRASPARPSAGSSTAATAFDLVVKFDPAAARLRAHRRSADRHAQPANGAPACSPTSAARRGPT